VVSDDRDVSEEVSERDVSRDEHLRSSEERSETAASDAKSPNVSTHAPHPRARRLRRVFVALTLLGLALWPPTQHALHRTHALGAWKHFGLGVYCRPKLDLRLELVAEGRTIDPRRLRRETHAAFADLRARTRELGMLTSADDAACRLMRDEDARVVEVRRTQDELGADGRIHTRRDVWRVEDEVCSRAAYAERR
jgi:hypothetical protein